MTEKQNKLVNDNMRLVSHTLKSLGVSSSDSYEDLFQEGCCGLCLAAKRFDETKGCKFSTYAISYISGYIQSYKFRHGTAYGIRMSRNQYKNNNIILKYIKDHGLDSTDSKVFEDTAKLLNLEYNYLHVSSLDQTLKDDDGVELQDLIPCNKDYLKDVETKLLLNDILNYVRDKFSNKIYEIYSFWLNYYMYNGTKINQTDLASKFNATQSYISSLIGKVNKNISEHFFKDEV